MSRLQTHAVFIHMPRLRYNDMVMLKWMLTIFMHQNMLRGVMKMRHADPDFNWTLMGELLEKEAEDFLGGNRTSIHQLIEDHMPQTGLDILICFMQLNKKEILWAVEMMDTNRANPLLNITQDFLTRFENTRTVYSVFPDWWLLD